MRSITSSSTITSTEDQSKETRRKINLPRSGLHAGETLFQGHKTDKVLQRIFRRFKNVSFKRNTQTHIDAQIQQLMNKLMNTKII